MRRKEIITYRNQSMWHGFSLDESLQHQYRDRPDFALEQSIIHLRRFKEVSSHVRIREIGFRIHAAYHPLLLRGRSNVVESTLQICIIYTDKASVRSR